MSEDSTLIGLVRDASRRLVRDLGFMNESLAGTDLSPSAVHALIEIEAREGITARDLGDILRLEKSSVSRMLHKLALSGDIIETPDEKDGRIRKLSLSEAGQKRVMEIHAFAHAQVARALGRLAPEQRDIVLDGLHLYAGCLAATADDGAAMPPRIVTGYRPGLIARITEMHALYYARTSGFGQRFETVVAGGLAAFCDRLNRAGNAVWTAVHGEKVVGSVAIDGEDLGPGIAHLRWFIMDDGVRGGGIGRQLLSAALDFADDRQFTETHLWTFAGLAAARNLYETQGFVCVEERTGTQWGNEMLEQRFVRPRPR
ncbi:helix-turn-helix domain-containing GNAT family N-acetyltransferase [Novosphingobium resinovorum]|uniref:bifunctional helix-turn-helix transcriptional regulator/GNAT family N-acetyltransferase n=1 Tax=Novosphingobium resinovorum TaxID=158500 RepID=UPI002ED4D668|nr:helix-turn-helix domain-containing GNAT family N-acetyltransferase [Novosphingobium resinovorum]